ncbi:MAG TPA: phosphoribosylglycinamide formyltransferase [Rhizomicrobium sp.]|jgi:phosphoribosylglycinamide formyltransferase-1|nr:phosphoribosylglycinamide formyltransferase [Rhizomicrobium sp.]
MTRVRTAALISGRGSNLKSLIEAARAPDYPAEIVLVVCNVESAGGLSIAREAGIETKVIPHKAYPTREAFDAAIDAALREARVALVCEAGFMRIHSAWFVNRWLGRILNIHPSLLPKFPGVKVHEQVLAAGESETGATVHFMTPELDAGPIVAQARVAVHAGDTVETLAARVLEKEHKLYPEALRLVAEGRVRLENGRAVARL